MPDDSPPPIKHLAAGRIECTVSFADGDAQRAEELAIQKLGQAVKIDGFRPGKAPTDVLRERIGEERILEETIRTLLPDAIESFIHSNDLKPIIAPKVDVVSRKPLTITITFVEKPTVKVKSIGKKAVTKKDINVEDKDIDGMVRYLLQQHQTTAPVTRAAKEGDKATIDFWGDDEAGVEIPGTRSVDYTIVIGSKTLIPGFEDALIGLNPGEKKSFSLTFPTTYQAEHLRGKPATFHVTMKAVEETALPELTDAFAQEKFGATSAEDFRTQIRTSMQKQEEDTDRKRREQQALDAIRAATVVDLAPELIAEEKRSLIDDLQRQLDRYHMTIEQWLAQKKKTEQEADREFDQQAKERITLRLGIEQYILDQQITVSDEELQQAIDALLAPLSANEQEEIVPAYRKGERAYEQFHWQKMVEKALATLTE